MDLTSLIVLPLFAWLIGSDVTNLAAIVNDPLGSTIDGAITSTGLMQWVLGGMAAIGLSVGVLLYEFSHSPIVMYYGYEIESITFWLFGGVARLKEIPKDWKQKFTIAATGPVVLVVVDITSYAGFLLLPESQTLARFVPSCLVLVNIFLAVFNMLPDFPMNGGRILRVLLARNRPHAKAMQMAAEVGKAFASLLGLFGLFFSLFLIAPAFLTYVGVSGEAQQTVLKATFQDVVVRDTMTDRENLDMVDRKTSVAELLECVFAECHTGYPVLRNSSPVDMVTLNDTRGIKKVKCDTSRVDDIMSDELATITPDVDAIDAIALIQERGVGCLPIIDEASELIGLVSWSDLVTAFNTIHSRGSFNTMSRPDAGLTRLR